MTKQNKLLCLIPIAAGLILAVGVSTALSACGPRDDGTWMSCHNTQIATAVCGAALGFLFVLSALIERRETVIICSALALILSIITILLPGILMRTCILETMRCNSVMKPFARIMAIITGLTAVHNFLHPDRITQEK